MLTFRLESSKLKSKSKTQLLTMIVKNFRKDWQNLPAALP